MNTGPNQMTKHESFTVVYRTGGTENCQWRRTSALSSKEAARDLANLNERMGYKSLVFKTGDLDSLGMPTGWEA